MKEKKKKEQVNSEHVNSENSIKLTVTDTHRNIKRLVYCA